MKRFYLFLFFIFNIYTARTQDSILIQSKLKEVTVTATRTTLSLKQLAQSIFTVRAEDIQSMAAQNTGEILQKTGLITVQKSQQGGGSPILRGMEASRVLLVLDGLRMNNIMYRAGHLQSIITVDPNILDRVEVLFGPASSVYGSDALGGVIHLISKSPDYASNSQYHSNVHMRYSTVNHEKMFHYDAQYAAQRFSALFSGSFTDFDDLRGGKNKNPFYTSYYGQRSVYYKSENGNDILIDNSKTPWIQASSGYKQWDLMGKIKFQSKSGKDHLFNLQYSSSSEIPRYDRLTDPSSTSVLRFSEWYYGPQKRFMASYKSEFGSQIPLKFNINYQQIEESRHNRQVQATNRQSRIEKVKILGFDLYHQRSIKTNQLLIGLDGQFEMLSSSAKATHIFSKIESPLDTRYPAGSNEMIRVGAYAILNNQINKAINTQSSIRFGYTGLSSDFGNTDFFKLPYKTVAQSNFTYSGNLGLNYALSESSRWGLVLASGYRAPNVDDLAKVFESTSGILIVPNPDLRPEKSLSFELNYRKLFENSNSNFSASAYITQLYNAIVTGPFKFNGKDSVFYDGKTSIVLANQNNRLARIFGVSLSGFISMNRSVSIRYGGTYTNGRILNQSKNTPLDHIPPISGKLGIEFKPSKKLNFDVDVIANAWKRLEDYLLLAEDNERYATEQGMPAWVIGNLHSTYRFTPNFRIGINLENILDTQYRVFASGINAAGRNISLSVHFKF